MANVPGKTDSSSVPTRNIKTDNPLDGQPSGGALDLNRASEQDIAEISMIGKKIARAIVEAREQRGGFASWDDLRAVQGLDAMKIAELQRATKLGPAS